MATDHALVEVAYPGILRVALVTILTLAITVSIASIHLAYVTISRPLPFPVGLSLTGIMSGIGLAYTMLMQVVRFSSSFPRNRPQQTTTDVDSGETIVLYEEKVATGAPAGP